MIRFIISVPARISFAITQLFTYLFIVLFLMMSGSGLTLYFLNSHLNSVCFVQDKANQLEDSVKGVINFVTFWD